MNMYEFLRDLPMHYVQYRSINKLYQAIDEQYHIIRAYSTRLVSSSGHLNADSTKDLEKQLEQLSHHISKLNFRMTTFKPSNYFLAFTRNKLKDIHDNLSVMHFRLGTLYRNLLVEDIYKQANIADSVRKLHEALPADRYAA